MRRYDSLVYRFEDRIISGSSVELVGPYVNDGMAIEFIHGSHDAILEFLFGSDADVAQYRAGELGEEPLDEIEPGAMRGRVGEFETAGRLIIEPSLGLLGDVRGMIIEDQLDRRMGRIGGVEKDRKSTRLNSSHSQISYAVFCLK